MQDPTDIAGLEKKHEEQATAQKLKVKTEAEDLKWLMSSTRGRRIVSRLLGDSGVYRLSFHTNALQMAFNEGNRNLGNKLLSSLTAHCPERYIELLSENKE